MPSYAYIRLSNAPLLPDIEQYSVRIAKYIEGLAPDMIDSNGNGIPNALEIEQPSPFSFQQIAEIEALGGKIFNSATEYLDHLHNLTI